jgi:hypothetical protein
MMGLLLKDLYVLKKYAKQVAFSLLFFLAFSVYLKSPAYLVGMIVMMTTSMVITSMSYDEAVKWNKYALTMPLIKKDIVQSKYLLLLLVTLAGTVVSGVAGLIVAVAMKWGDYMGIVIAAGVVLLIAITLFSILLPIIIKYGVEKARLIMVAIFVAPTFLIMGFAKLMDKLNVSAPSLETIKMLGYASPFIALLIVFISYQISMAIFNKKEF